MMTQAEYLSRLEYLLHSLPDDRKWELLDDIRQHFDEGIASGLPEADIAEGLGAPELLAQEYTDAFQDPAANPAPILSRRKPSKASPASWGASGAVLACSSWISASSFRWQSPSTPSGSPSW